MSNLRCQIVFISLNHRQHISTVNSRADFHVDGGYRSGLWTFHFILHLHGFDYDNAGSGFNLSADFHQNAHNLTRHRSDDAYGSISHTGGFGRSAQTFWVSERDREPFRAHKNIDRLSRSGLTVNAAIENGSIRTEDV